MSTNKLVKQTILDAHYVADGNIEKFQETLVHLILEEAATYIDQLRSGGFTPTGYLLLKHFGLK